MDEDTFRILRDTDWGAMGKNLLAVAINVSRKYPSIGYQTCDDIVQDLIEKTLTGQRTWDPARGELLPWLKQCIKSEVDNAANKAPTQREVQFSELEKDGAESGADFLPEQVSLHAQEGLFDPENSLLDKEQQIRNEEDIVRIYKSIEGDGELEELTLTMHCLIEEHEELEIPSRQKLAEYLSVPVSEIDNRMKRLRRCLKRELVK